MPGDLTILGDERQVFRQEQFFITFFDEMAKADKVSVDALKNRITAERVQYRLLGSNVARTSTNNTTFIGATNDDLRDVIYDPSGMRRFHQMETRERIDWDEINAIDYDEMWASADNAAGCPLLPVMDVLRKHQDDLRAKDTVEEWYEESCLKTGEWTSATVLFDHYCSQMRAQGRRAVTQTKFGRRLLGLVERDIGGEGDGWKVSDGKKYALALRDAGGEDMISSLEKLVPDAAKKLFDLG
jgi:hypothetical protein